MSVQLQALRRCADLNTRLVNQQGGICRGMPGIFPITGFSHPSRWFSTAHPRLGCICSPSLHVNTSKMSAHENLTSYKYCVKKLLFHSSKQSAMKSQSGVWHAQNASKLEMITARTFRIVYLVGWKHLSFSVHKYLFDLQRQNGLDIMKHANLTHSLSNIVHFIVSEMCSKLVNFILAKLMNEKDVARSSRYIPSLSP